VQRARILLGEAAEAVLAACNMAMEGARVAANQIHLYALQDLRNAEEGVLVSMADVQAAFYHDLQHSQQPGAPAAQLSEELLLVQR
jgi:hypothetical protein